MCVHVHVHVCECVVPFLESRLARLCTLSHSNAHACTLCGALTPYGIEYNILQIRRTSFARESFQTLLDSSFASGADDGINNSVNALISTCEGVIQRYIEDDANCAAGTQPNADRTAEIVFVLNAIPSLVSKDRRK